MGPQRAGTSWLDRYMRSRGDICMPGGVKEIFFFDRHYERGQDFYRGHFKPAAKHRLVMEISTTSFDTAGAARRVRETFGPGIRLLCPLRHPVTRSYSLYQHYKRYGIVSGNLQQACEQNPQILSSSYYARHLEEWLDQFDINAIHFVFQEDMENDLAAFVTAVCNALQVPVMLPTAETSRRYNSAAAAPIPVLARAAHHGASWLRRYQLYPVINAAKSLGFKHAILGVEKPDTQNPIPAEDRAWLEDRLFGQAERIEKIIGPVAAWGLHRA